MIDYITYGLSILSTIGVILAMQFKSMKKIVVGQTLVNLMVAVSYFVLGGLSGAGICFIAIFQGILMYFFDRKEKKAPLWVVLFFLVLYIACSLVYFKGIEDLFPAIAAVCFGMSIVQQRPAASRLWYLPNPLLWCCYDLLIGAYGNLVMHFIVFICTLVGILRLDRKK